MTKLIDTFLDPAEIKVLRKVFNLMADLGVVDKLDSTPREGIYLLPANVLIVDETKIYFESE